MHIKRYFPAMLLIFAIAGVGCTSNPLRNLQDQMVPNRLDGTTQTVAKVEKGILAGCIDKGWSCNVVNEGLIEASLSVRQHRALAQIPYSAGNYSIVYQDSQMLDYNGKRNTIHRNYNRWVNNLDDAISKRLAY
jgi:hypothetical protein